MGRLILIGLGPEEVLVIGDHEYSDGDDMECDAVLYNMLVKHLKIAVPYTEDLKRKVVRLVESAVKKRQQIANKMKKYKERS